MHNLKIGRMFWHSPDAIPTLVAEVAYRTQEHKGFITRFKTFDEMFVFEVLPTVDGRWQIYNEQSFEVGSVMHFDMPSDAHLVDVRERAEELVRNHWRICDRCNTWYFADELQTRWENDLGIPFCSAHCLSVWESHMEALD